MAKVLLRMTATLTCAALCRGEDQCDEWGINFVIIFLPMLILSLLAFAFAVFRALHFRNLFRKMHEANQIYLFEQRTAAAVVQKKGQGADAIALDLNKAHIKELQDDNARLACELNRLREELVASNSQLRVVQEQLARLRASERVVEKPVEVTKIVEVPVERVVEVPVPHVVEVPTIVEKTVEVQKLVVDKAAQLQLQYANDDIEYLKRELIAARSQYHPRVTDAEEPMMDDMPSPYPTTYDTTPLVAARSSFDPSYHQYDSDFPPASALPAPSPGAFNSVRIR